MTRAMADGMDMLLAHALAGSTTARLPPERQRRLLPYIRDWIARGAALDGAAVFRGYSQMGALRDAAVAACAAVSTSCCRRSARCHASRRVGQPD